MSKGFDGNGWTPDTSDALAVARGHLENARRTNSAWDADTHAALSQAAALVDIAESLRRIAPEPVDAGVDARAAMRRGFPALADAAERAMRLGGDVA